VRADAFAAAALAFGFVGALGAASGGYYPTSWGWAAIGALLGGSVAVLVGASMSRGATLCLGLLAALTAWTAFECARPGAATRGMPLVQRDALYLALAWCAFLVVRRTTVQAALCGCLAAIAALTSYGLAVLLLGPVTADVYEGRLLFLPVGYANGMGMLAALGLLLALGIAVESPPRGAALAAGAAVPLALALALTESRGAQLAACAGVALALAAHPRRRQLAAAALVILPLPAVLAVVGSHLHAIDDGAPSRVVAHDSRVLAVLLAGAVCVQVLWASAPAPVLARRLERIALPVCVGAAVLAAAFVIVHGLDVGGDRTAYWHVAWGDAQANPLLGSGPGSYASAWLEHRTNGTSALNAHSLFLETLAELGPVGLVLLCAALAVPLTRVRRAPIGASCAYAALVVHLALDWDWQLPVVIAAGLVCAAALLSDGASWTPPPRARGLVLAGAAMLALFSAAGALGSSAIDDAMRAEHSGSWGEVEWLAATARTWQPWSATPVRLQGDAAAARGDRPAARRLYREAVGRDPTDVRAWVGLALVGTGVEHREALARLAGLDPRAFSGYSSSGSASR
jgi:hypothetical protein